jgi:hypothetical protein
VQQQTLVVMFFEAPPLILDMLNVSRIIIKHVKTSMSSEDTLFAEKKKQANE